MEGLDEKDSHVLKYDSYFDQNYLTVQHIRQNGLLLNR